MPQIINFSFPTIFDEELPGAMEAYSRVRELHGSHEGWVSSTIWRNVNDATQYGVATHYQSEDSALAALLILTEAGIVDQLINAMQIPPDLKRMRIDHRNGGMLDATSIGHFMSLSFRRAEPGFSDDLEAELATIFESLQYIEGYIGSAYGYNPQVEEEVLGMVLWRSQRAFEESLPEKATYEVRLFERIA